MTQHMGMMDFSDEEEGEGDQEKAIGYLQLMPPFSERLGWSTREFKDGETTIGRNDDQDLTIADASVSSNHATIDVVDVPAAGGKCITLKDLRSTNGTYLIDAVTGAKTRLAPKKATMMPKEGCKIHFGGVVCKMAMGPVPDDDPSAIADKVDDGMATSTVYEADTQLPGPTLHGEEDETGTMPATKEADGTEPLLENDDTLAALAPAQGSHDTGGNNERERGVGGEQQERMPAATRNEAEGVADACTGEGSGEVQGEVQGEPRRVTTLPLMDTAVAVEKGVRFEEPGSAEKAEDGRGDGGSSDEDEGTVLEPPTQIMLLEIDDSNDEAEVDGTSGGARVADKVTLSIADDGAGAGDDSSAILAEGAGAAGGRESTVDLSKGEGDSASDGLDNGDETADEGDTACLFENEEDDEVSKAMGEADTTAQASAGEAGREATSISLSATPMTPSTVPEYASGRITSPGGASDVSTQRQESPGKNSTLTEGSEREEVQVPAVTLTRNGGVVEKGSEGGGEVGTTASAVGKAEGGESAVGVGQGSEGREKPVDDDDDGVDDDADDDDDASELSAALIPAQDLSGFEDDLDENVGPEEEENPLDATIPRDEGGAAADGEEGGDAVGNTVGGDSGSETDATEFDSDDGPTGHIRPESPYASPGGRGIKADPSSPARGRVSPPSRSWDIEPQPNATEKSHNEQVMSLGETRSPGGSLLRRTSTEDAMHAIAREQQRADAARCSAESARGAAAAIACDSGEDQEELKGRPEAEAEVETDKRKDLAKQALAMDANSDSDARSDDEDVIHGTMIIELEEPETALDETEVIEEEEERLDLDADGAGKRDDGREATRDGVREAAEQPTENVAQQEAHREDEVHEGDTRFRGHQTASASAVPSPAGNALHGREHSPIKGKEGVTTPPEVGDAAGYSPDNGLIGEVESAKDDDSPVKPSVDKTVGHVDDSIRDGQGELASAAAAEDATVRGAIAHGVEGGFNEARDANDGSGNEADGTWSEEETEKRGASPEREGEGQQEKREEYQTKTKEEPTGDDAGRKTSEGDRLGQALDPPAPRTSGRRRVKPRMFDEMDVEPTASNSPTPHDEAHSTDKLGSVANEAARDGKEGQGASDGEARIESDSGDGPDDPGIEAHSPPPSPVSGERDRRSDEDAGTSSDAAAGDKVVRGPSQEIVAMPDPAVEDDAKEKPDPPLRRRKRRRGGVGESPTEEEDKTEGTYGEDGDDRITLLDGGGARKRGRRTLRAAVTATPSSAENDTAQNNSPAPSEAEGRGGGRLRRGTAQAVATEKPHSSLTTDKAKGRGRKRNAAEVTCTKGEAEEEADLEDTEAATESVHKKQRGRPAVSPATSRRGQGSRRRKNGEERPESPASDPARDGVRDERETESDAVIDGNEDESVLSPPPKGNGRRGRNTKSKSASAGKPLTTAAASVPALSKRGESRPTAASAGASSVGEDEGASSSPPTSVKASRRGKATSPDPPVTSPSAVGDRSSGIAGAGGEEAEDVKVCFTGVKPTPKERKCIDKLGISEVENVLEATHLVAGGSGVPLKRTPKLLAGIGCCRFVVDIEWLYQSAKEGKILDGLEFILCDAEAENKWGFNMRTSLGRRLNAGVLFGLQVHVDPVVASTKGMGCPPLNEMKTVVISAGGKWLPQLPKRGGSENQSLLVISHPDALKAAGVKGAKSRAAAAAARNGTAYLPEMLFLCILKQRVLWPSALAVRDDEVTAGGAEKKQPTKRRRT